MTSLKRPHFPSNISATFCVVKKVYNVHQNLYQNQTMRLFIILSLLFITTVSMSQAKVTPVTNNPPYSGPALDKYCSNPKRLLVIETKQGVMKIQLFDKVAPN